MASGEDLSIGLIEKIRTAHKGRPMEIRSEKKDTVHLVDGNGKIVSTPPSGEYVPALLGQLLDYERESPEDTLVKCMVFHADFEIIHPFIDGNGRTGRILIESLLYRYGLLGRPVLFLSRFLMANRRDYQRCLKYVERDGRWDKYLTFMFCGVKECADHTYSLIKDIRRSLERAYVICAPIGISHEVVDQIYSHVYIRAKHLVEAGLVSRNTASAYLLKMEDLGILRGEQAGKGRIYLNAELFDLLTK